MSEPELSYPTVLTIAGSDSGGGAGIQADLKTFTVLGAYGMSAITAVTAQNTTAVTDVQTIKPSIVRAQIDAVMSDIGCKAAKTGMLANCEIVQTVASAVSDWDIPHLVVDPVMIAKSGDRLLEDDATDAVMDELLPLAEIVTPNLPEAEALTGMTITSRENIAEAGRKLCSTGCRAAVIKGGHMEGAADDYLYQADEDSLHVLTAERVDTENTHGTGCTFSAAIAACLAYGLDIQQSVTVAKEFITYAIQSSLSLGSGHGPVDHIGAGAVIAQKFSDSEE
ncbi:MAG: bifunctional hydroxymethylpyrimidine kinase/phosphomethylpyrimidine kinase [Armatimonadota bacterium]